MHRFVCLAMLLACVALVSTTTIEAASSLQKAAPKVKRMADGVSSWLWKNKGGVATGAVVTAFVTQPEPFVEAAASVATNTLTNATKTAVESIVPKSSENSWPIARAVFSLTFIIVALMCLVVLCKRGSRLLTKLGLVAIIVAVLLLGPSVASASELGCVTTMATATPSFFPSWRLIVDVLLIVIMLLPLGI